MRIQILSDFHFDVRAGYTPELAIGADVVVVPGDVCEGPARAMAWLRAHIPAPTPIVYLAGNHEYYNHGLAEERARAPSYAEEHGIIWLDDSSVEIGGVHFIGATLWTDFKLFGASNQFAAMHASQSFMTDYAAIAVSETGIARIKPKDTLEMHEKSRAFLAHELAKVRTGKAVVVTHHAPHQRSVAEQYARDPVTPAFVSDLETLILDHKPALWVHGHTHTSFDYLVGATRIVCNPKGYGSENRAFEPLKVVEI